MPKTIEEVARDTGFSVTTVKLIANGQAAKYRISKSTQQIVEDYIRRHGYVVNHAARSLKLRRTDTVGLVVPEVSQRLLRSPDGRAGALVPKPRSSFADGVYL